MSINKDFKKAISSIKFNFELNQADIAERLGVKSTYLSDMINGRVPLSENISNKIYELFQIVIEEDKILKDGVESKECEMCKQKEKEIERLNTIIETYEKVLNIPKTEEGKKVNFR